MFKIWKIFGIVVEILATLKEVLEQIFMMKKDIKKLKKSNKNETD